MERIRVHFWNTVGELASGIDHPNPKKTHSRKAVKAGFRVISLDYLTTLFQLQILFSVKWDAITIVMHFGDGSGLI